MPEWGKYIEAPARAKDETDRIIFGKSLEEAIAQLSEREQKVIQMFLEGDSEEEISRAYPDVSLPEVFAKLREIIISNERLFSNIKVSYGHIKIIEEKPLGIGSSYKGDQVTGEDANQTDVEKIEGMIEANQGTTISTDSDTKSSSPVVSERQNILPVNKKGGIDPSLHSGSIPQQENLGGIDFRALPIVTQAMNNLRLSASSSISLSQLNSINLNQELQEIQRLLGAGMTPATERIKEYLQASCAKGSILQDKDKVILCIADILRSQEQTCSTTDPALRDILVVLETSGSSVELSRIFLG